MREPPWLLNYSASFSQTASNMSREFSAAELEAYLDEGLSPAEMAAVEAALRTRPELITQLAAINRRRDAGMHTLGEIWRRRRLSCPSRDQLGSYLMSVLDEGEEQFIRFHIEVSGCRICAANLDDLRRRQQETPDNTNLRRRKYFQSSAGYLRGADG